MGPEILNLCTFSFRIDNRTAVEDITKQLLEIAKVKEEDYQVVILQGSGTYGVESVLGCSIPKEKHFLCVFSNGLYGTLMATLAKSLGIQHLLVEIAETEVITCELVAKTLKENPETTHVAMVHGETTSGVINPIEDIGATIYSMNPEIVFIVDAIGSFGAYIPNLYKGNISYMVGSSNKCFQGVPGFAYAICKKERLENTKNNIRSTVLSLYEQWDYMKKTRLFRYTPPIQVLLAFWQALKEYKAEGQEERLKRYSNNQK